MSKNDRKVIPLPGLRERYVNTGVIQDHYVRELDRIKDALQDKEGDPYIKGILLEDLRVNRLDVTVPVHKFGQDVSVDIGAMKAITEDDFFIAVKAFLSTALESDNPTLFDMALQLWEHFMVTMFPLALEPESPEIWGAAVYQMVHEMNGMKISHRQTAERFHVSESGLMKAAEKIEMAERTTSV